MIYNIAEKTMQLKEDILETELGEKQFCHTLIHKGDYHLLVLRFRNDIVAFACDEDGVITNYDQLITKQCRQHPMYTFVKLVNKLNNKPIESKYFQNRIVENNRMVQLPEGVTSGNSSFIERDEFCVDIIGTDQINIYDGDYNLFNSLKLNFTPCKFVGYNKLTVSEIVEAFNKL